jgi:hypothetical protein
MVAAKGNMALQAAEKAWTGQESNTSGAKAQRILNRFTARLKSCPDTKHEFFRTLFNADNLRSVRIERPSLEYRWHLDTLNSRLSGKVPQVAPQSEREQEVPPHVAHR